MSAALEIVAERGLEALTLLEAGQRAGYSRALPAHYFGSKDQLVSALADYVVEGFVDRMQNADFGGAGLDSLLKRIAFYIDDGKRDLESLRAFHAILNAAVTNPVLRPSTARLNSESALSYARMIEAGINNGEICPDIDPMAQGRLILIAMRGILTQWLIAPDAVNVELLRDTFLSNLKRALAK